MRDRCSSGSAGLSGDAMGESLPERRGRVGAKHEEERKSQHNVETESAKQLFTNAQ